MTAWPQLSAEQEELSADGARLTACRVQKDSAGAPVRPRTATKGGDAQAAVAEGPAGRSVSGHAQR